MPREVAPSEVERAYALQALETNLRLDGRGFDELRKISIQFGDEYGAVDVTLGSTRAVVRISAEIAQPFPDRQFEGVLTIVTELSPVASPAFETGRPADLEIILSRVLEKAIRRSGAIDTESLCISAGGKCWFLHADVHILDYDGGIFDASCLALVTALRHFRRPDVSIEGDNVIIFSQSEREPIPLVMLHHPFCITTVFFHDGEIALLDSTLIEIQLSQGEIVVTANKDGEICQITKMGGTPANAVKLLEVLDLAVLKVRELDKMVTTAIQNDALRRKSRNPSVLLSADNNR
ncbi:hypothetical protein MMC25_008362 [Agyrium rufum]|nr:hypothetical protein [Agyrium rufum]